MDNYMRNGGNKMTKNNFNFTFGEDYKTEFTTYVNEIITVAKAQVQAKRNFVKKALEKIEFIYGKISEEDKALAKASADHNLANTLANRSLRMLIIENLTDCYVAATGERPEGTELERLTNAILYEELYSDDNYYVKHTEYPILNERKHESRTHRDVKDEGLETIDSGRANRRKPTKRKRGKYENAFVDKHARSRNKERQAKYREFTKVQPVIVRHISELGGDEC
jgi:hypothetical protein